MTWTRNLIDNGVMEKSDKPTLRPVARPQLLVERV